METNSTTTQPKFYSRDFANAYVARTTDAGHIEIAQTMNGFVIADTFRADDGTLHLFAFQQHLGPVTTETDALVLLDRAIIGEWL